MRLLAASVFVCLVIGGAGPAAMAQKAEVVDKPGGAGKDLYVGNRAPLAPAPLIKLPIGAIEPRGWLRVQLELMRDGMTGHLDELSHWVQLEDSAWLSKKGEGKNGWEELPYWLKGVGDLGYVLKDERLTALAKRWVEGVMAAQREDGYFGSEENRGGGPENMQLGVAGKLKGPDLWPQMPMLDALKSWHEATGDKRVLEFMTRYFAWQAKLPKEQLLAGSWQKIRGGDNLESVLWLYNRTGDAWLLDLARTLHENTAPWKDKVASWHGVNICQGFREPAVFWMLSKDPKDLAAAERNYQEVMGLYGQVPGGMFGADENARRGFGDPRQAAETCSMVEFMNSFEQLLRFTGDGLFADRCEEVAFNSLPAAFSPDYKALHYLTSPNMVQLDRNSKAPGLANGGTMISYEPGEAYRCCQHNHAMGWPYYAEHLWMATPDAGLAAVLYAPSEVTAKVGDGVEVRIAQETGYPFEDAVTLSIETSKPTGFPLYVRVPAWCKAATAVTPDGRVEGEAGKYIRIERVWKTGDQVRLRLPMGIELKRWTANKDSVSVRRGPLWYSLKIEEEYRKYGGTEAWPSLEVYPKSAWNFGLVLNDRDPAASFRVERVVSEKPQVFEAGNEPVRLVGKGQRIPNWQQDRTGLVGTLNQSPVKSDEPVETLVLIPMGCARLRISAFPVIGDGPDAKEWPEPPPVRHEASYENDDINAISDGKEPRNSADHSIPRYTWWDHKGTTEWVTYKLGQSRRVSSCAVYWFDDTGIGQCRTPESWKVWYRDGEAWREAKLIGKAGTDTDQFNAVVFEPVMTGELKIEVKLREGFSGGILEWKVGDAK